MIESILKWLVEIILEMALKEATSKIEQAKTQAERNKLNAENAEKYRQALDRKERIKGALDLINGTHS